jgi:hypothetical protein
MRQDARKIDLAAFNERSELPPSFPNPASKHAFYARTLQVDPLSNIDRNILSGCPTVTILPSFRSISNMVG